MNLLQPDKDLRQKIAQGDEAAFNIMVERYTNSIYEIALAYIKIIESAEDITQEIFYKVWKNRERLREVKSLKDYLFIMTRNEVLNALRKKGPRYPVGDYLENKLEEKETNMLPEQTLAIKGLQKAVQEAISLLPKQQKDAYLLSRELDCSHEEIAKKMNLSKNTVKNHIVAALNFIRRYLEVHTDSVFLLVAFLLLS